MDSEADNEFDLYQEASMKDYLHPNSSLDDDKDDDDIDFALYIKYQEALLRDYLNPNFCPDDDDNDPHGQSLKSYDSDDDELSLQPLKRRHAIPSSNSDNRTTDTVTNNISPPTVEAAPDRNNLDGNNLSGLLDVLFSPYRTPQHHKKMNNQ